MFGKYNYSYLIKDYWLNWPFGWEGAVRKMDYTTAEM